MATRTQDFSAALVANYGADATRIWTTASSSDEVEKSVLALPGFGAGKVSKLVPAMRLFGHEVAWL